MLLNETLGYEKSFWQGFEFVAGSGLHFSESEFTLGTLLIFTGIGNDELRVEEPLVF